MSLKGYRWRYLFTEIRPPEELVKKYGYLLAQLLVNRGLEAPPREEKISVPKKGLPNIDKAAERILHTIKSGEPIFIFGDYDADGLTSTAIFYKLLKQLGAKKVVACVPERGEGYGLQPPAVETFYKYANGKGGLIVALDNGTKEIETIAYAKRLGFDVVIFDHHTPGETLPDCILVNPKAEEDTPQFLKDLSTAGLAFLFAKYLQKEGYKIEAERFADLSAVGTVADVVPLSGINAKIVSKGLKNISEGVFSSKGLKVLFENLELENPNGRDIAFRIAPRINSFGRMDNANDGLEFLKSDNEDLVLKLFGKMEILNLRRKRLTSVATERVRRYYEEAPSKGLIYVAKDIPHGVLGIVAGRITSELGIPSVIMTIEGDTAVGSSRSPEGINIVKVLEKLDPLMERWGGHSQAAGLSVKVENLERFKEEFLSEVSKYEPAPPTLEIDFFLEPKKFRENPRLVEVLKRLEPYGEGNRHPTFVFEDRLVSFSRTRYGYRLNFERNGTMFVYCDSSCKIPSYYNGARVRVVYIVENPSNMFLSVEDMKIVNRRGN
jgi:single-stranded-DNA-specific exonuclease